MSVEILHDSESDVAVLIDSVVGHAFGPAIHGPDADEKADSFREWLLTYTVADPLIQERLVDLGRTIMEAAFAQWLSEHVCADCSVLLDPPGTVHMHGCKHYEET